MRRQADRRRATALLVSPPVFIGGLVFLRARNHLEEDAAKIFAAILAAMEAEKETAEAETAADTATEEGPS